MMKLNIKVSGDVFIFTPPVKKRDKNTILSSFINYLQQVLQGNNYPVSSYSVQATQGSKQYSSTAKLVLISGSPNSLSLTFQAIFNSSQFSVDSPIVFTLNASLTNQQTVPVAQYQTTFSELISNVPVIVTWTLNFVITIDVGNGTLIELGIVDLLGAILIPPTVYNYGFGSSAFSLSPPSVKSTCEIVQTVVSGLNILAVTPPSSSEAELCNYTFYYDNVPVLSVTYLLQPTNLNLVYGVQLEVSIS